VSGCSTSIPHSLVLVCAFGALCRVESCPVQDQGVHYSLVALIFTRGNLYEAQSCQDAMISDNSLRVSFH
jgi:hypothetical protein